MKRTGLIIAFMVIILASAYSQDAETNRAELLLRLEEINAAIILAPQDYSLYYERADVYYLLKEHEKAIEEINYLLVHDPAKRDYYYYLRAYTFSDMDKHSDALEDINRAIEYNPRDGRYYITRGDSYAGMGMEQEALIAFTKAIELLGSSDHYPYYARGLTYFRLGKYQEAIADCTKAIELSPNHFHSYYYRGQSYSEIGKCQEAVDDHTRVIEINPRVYKSFIYRGILYMRLGMPDKAIEDIDYILKLGSTDANTLGTLYGYRGAAYRLKGASNESYYKQALADLTRAIEYRPIALWFDQRAILYEAMAKKVLRRSVKNEYLDRAKRDRESAERVRGGSE
jgi:tetratricopeptide (TPR) repeat protein